MFADYLTLYIPGGYDNHVKKKPKKILLNEKVHSILKYIHRD
jgi:hypothetical protein